MASSLETLELRVRNLDCEHDAAALERGLSGAPGIGKVRVLPKSAKVILGFDPSQTSAKTLKEKLTSLGFPPQQGREIAAPPKLWRNAKVLTSAASGLLLAAGWLVGLAGVPEAASMVIYVAAIGIGGYFFAREAIEELFFEREVGIELLMSVAAIAALVLGQGAEAAMLVFLYSISEALEGYTETAMFGSAAPGTDHTYLAFYRRTGGVDTLLSRSEDFGKPAYFDLLIYYGPDQTGANVLQARIDGTIVAYYGTMQLIREVGPPQNLRVCLASGTTAHTFEIDDFICIRRQGNVNDCIPDQYQLCNWTPGGNVTDATWEVVSGSWTSSGADFTTSNSNALLVSKKRPYHDRPEIGLTFTLPDLGYLPGRTPRVVFNYIDADNYDYFEYGPGSWPEVEMRVYRRQAGSDSLVKSTIGPHRGYSGFTGGEEIYLCIRPESVQLQWGFAPLKVVSVPLVSPADGGHVGLATGADMSGGSLTIRGFACRVPYDLGPTTLCSANYGCSPVICPAILPGTLPDQLQTNLPAGTMYKPFGPSACPTPVNECPQIDGSYLADHLHTCHWRYRFPETICGKYLRFDVTLVDQLNNGNYQLLVSLSHSATGTGGWNVFVTWSRPVTVPLDGSTINLTTTTINNTQNSPICWAQQQITVETP